MPEAQPTPDQYIEPPPAGYMGGPMGTPSDTFGVQPRPAPPPQAPPTGPPDEVIQPQGGQPMRQVGYDPSITRQISPNLWWDGKARILKQGTMETTQVAGPPPWTADPGNRGLVGDTTGKEAMQNLRPELKVPTLQQTSGMISPELHEAHEQLHAAGQAEKEAITQGKAEIQRLIDAEPPGSAKRDKLIDEMHADIATKEAAWKEKYDHPPVLKPVDAFQNFGSIGTIVGLIGGLFARRHMTAALGAAGKAMQAINQNNFDQYQQQMKVWETQTRSAAEELHMQHQDLEMLIRDKQLSWDQKQALIGNKFREIGLDREVAAVQHGDAQTWMQTIATMDRAQNQLKNLTGQMSIANRALAEQNWNQKYYADHPDMAGQPVPLDEQVKRNQYLDQNFPLPGAPHAQQPRNLPAMAAQKFKEEHPDATAQDIAEFGAEYKRLGAVETGFASGILGRQVIALNTVADHLLLVQEYAEALRNGQIPRANAVANRIATELGKPEITSFEAGRDIMADEIVRLLTTTGGTEADRAGMQSRISSSMSPTQLAGAIKVFERFTAGRFEALEQQYAGNDEGRRKHFQDTLLTDKARKVFVNAKGGESGDAAKPPAVAAPAKVGNQADYDALPPGAQYLAPDGKVRTKP